MKRLIALVGTFLFAIFSNLSPILPKDAPYQEDMYYTVSESGEVDYRKLYATYHNSQVQYIGECDTSPKQVDSKVKPQLSSGGGDNDAGLYWLRQATESPIIGNLTNEWTTDLEGVAIVAPTDCLLVSSHNNCNFGKTMVVEVTLYEIKYQITLDNLKCWWCCRDKEAPADGKYSLSGALDPKNSTVRKGNMLAIATANTTVTILRADNASVEITLENFYSLQAIN